MVQNIHKLQDRQYKALIGLNKKQFNVLTVVFSECNLAIKEAHYQAFLEYYDRKPSSGGSPIFKLPSEKLFLVLYYLKNYPTFDVLGFTFNCSGKTAHENLYKFLPILIMALDKLGCLPKRSFDSVEEFINFTKENDDLIIDATERAHHRKKDYDEQKKYYNGKKKMHTVKNTVISTPTQKVLFLGLTVLGSKHDYGLFKSEFTPGQDWFKDLSVWIDLGYLGFEKDYQSTKTHIPFKKPYKTKKNPNPQLTDQQKEHNRNVSKTRVKVENAIGGIKRYAILQQRFRNKSEYLRDNAIFAATGLWNFFKDFSFA